jgi:hypothetical protein
MRPLSREPGRSCGLDEPENVGYEGGDRFSGGAQLVGCGQVDSVKWPQGQRRCTPWRIFAEFIAGFGVYGVAERLTADGVPCPSAHDWARNSHRCGLAWSKSAVRVILANPQ